MSTSNAPRTWPWPAERDDNAADPSFGFENLLEAQTRLWNHLLDANRSFWTFYTPWLPTGPWTSNAPAPSHDPEEAGIEPAQTADGIPDALELQTRSWNRFLDAQRSFWATLNWPVPPTPWMSAANESGPAQAEPNVIDVDKGPVSTKPAAADSKPRSAAAKSKRSSRAARAR